MRVWAHGLVSAAIGGTAAAVTASFAAPQAVNLTASGLTAMCKIACAGALLSALAYLKQSPLPGNCDQK